MSLLKELVKLMEDASAGVTSTASVATVPSRIGTKKVIKRNKKSFVRFKKSSKKVMESDEINYPSVLSKLRASDKDNQNTDLVYFGLEDDAGSITRVGVRKTQAKEFEEYLSQQLGEYNDVNKLPINKALPSKEIAEILFNVKEKFDIVDVEWPDIEEDEEEVNTPVDNQDGPVPPADGENPDTEPMDDTTPPASDNDSLKDIIDYLKKDAEAKAEEAKARAAEAKTRELEITSNQEDKKLKREEELLDMESYYKEQKDKEAEARKLSQLAKFRQDKAKELEVDSIGSENEETTSKALNITPETLMQFLNMIQSTNSEKKNGK